MKYNIIINQEAAIRLNLDVDYLDLAIFDCVSNILNCPEFPSLLIPSTGRTFKWISTKLILKELPLLGLKERAIRTRLDKLETSKLLLKYVDTRDGNKPYYAQGANFSAMFRTDADPRNLDADPRNLDADPRNLDADPRNLDADPRPTLGIWMPTLGIWMPT